MILFAFPSNPDAPVKRAAKQDTERTADNASLKNLFLVSLPSVSYAIPSIIIPYKYIFVIAITVTYHVVCDI